MERLLVLLVNKALSVKKGTFCITIFVIKGMELIKSTLQMHQLNVQEVTISSAAQISHAYLAKLLIVPIAVSPTTSSSAIFVKLDQEPLLDIKYREIFALIVHSTA